jgi:pilus assembly protein Flp/PilA
MKVMKQLWMFSADKRAVTALEYGLIAVLVALVALGGFQLLGTSLSSTMNSLAQSL